VPAHRWEYDQSTVAQEIERAEILRRDERCRSGETIAPKTRRNEAVRPRWRRAARRDSARASRILIAGHRVVTKVERLAALIRRRSEHHVITDHHPSTPADSASTAMSTRSDIEGRGFNVQFSVEP